jgi:hypothetical protein
MLPVSLLPKIIDGLGKWKCSQKWSKNGGEFTDQIASFINGKMWDDEPLPSPGIKSPREIIEEETRRMEEEAEWKRNTFKNGQKTTA